jgi:hypothetical protein
MINPWDDVVDLPGASITYWGDAKLDPAHPDRTADDFRGNRKLRDAFALVRASHLATVPPILHFTKPSPGIVRFNGLCVLAGLFRTTFTDPKGNEVMNYRADLTILNERCIEVACIHERVRAQSLLDVRGDGPPAWRRYLEGSVDRLTAGVGRSGA